MRKSIILLYFFIVMTAGYAQDARCYDIFDTAYRYFRLHNWKPCISYFLKTERCGIRESGLYFSLGRAYLATDRYDSAIHYLNICDSVYHSDYLWMFGNRGIAYKGLKKYDASRRDLDRALRLYEHEVIHPDDDGWMLYRERAWLNIETNKPEEAESDFYLAIEENPDTVMNYVELCELYGMIGKYEKVLEEEKHIKDYCHDNGHLTVYTFHKLFAKVMLQQPVMEEERTLDSLLKTPFHIIWYFENFNEKIRAKGLSQAQLDRIYGWQRRIEGKR